jgi:hypothetical protein
MPLHLACDLGQAPWTVIRTHQQVDFVAVVQKPSCEIRPDKPTGAGH